MATKVDTILALTQSTLQKFISRTNLGWLNEAAPKTFLGGKLLKRCKKRFDGGKAIDFDVQFDKVSPGQWVGANEKLEFKGTKAPTRGTVPWRFYQDAWYKDFKEIDLNKGAKEVVFDLLQNAKEQVGTATVQEFEDVLIAKDGNYDHDESGSSWTKPLGLKYWCTIDGLHITGSGTVGNISPATYTDWKNAFINPVAASDGLSAINHVRDLPLAMERMAMEMYFESADVWSPLSKDIKHVDSKDFDSSSSKGTDNLMLVSDRRTNLEYREVLFDQRDDVGKDQFRGRPSWRGIVVDWDVNLGLGAGGYGQANSDSSALWTDRGGNYANGNWVNGGEMYFINTKYFHMACHGDHMPMTKDPYMPEGMFGLGFEYDFWLQTFCRSRRRGLGVIAGYSLDT